MYSNETLIFGKGEGVRLFCKVGGTHMPKVGMMRICFKFLKSYYVELQYSTAIILISILIRGF